MENFPSFCSPLGLTQALPNNTMLYLSQSGVVLLTPPEVIHLKNASHSNSNLSQLRMCVTVSHSTNRCTNDDATSVVQAQAQGARPLASALHRRHTIDNRALLSPNRQHDASASQAMQ